MERSQFAEKVYDTVNGFVVAAFCVENVENLFTPGKPCDTLYHKMTIARERLAKKTGLKEDDEDIEEIIELLLKIARIVGIKMFEYGSQLGMREENL